jgi:hypothetical protein
VLKVGACPALSVPLVINYPSRELRDRSYVSYVTVGISTVRSFL